MEGEKKKTLISGHYPELNPSNYKNFCDNFAENLNKLTEKPVATLKEKDGEYQIAHHHMKTPFPMSNRSMIVAYYMIDGQNGDFTFCWSTQGNEQLARGQYAKEVGKDELAECTNVLIVSAHSKGGSQVKV